MAEPPENDAPASCDVGTGRGPGMTTRATAVNRMPSPTEVVTEGPQGSGSGSGKRKWQGLNPEDVVVLEDSQL